MIKYYYTLRDVIQANGLWADWMNYGLPYGTNRDILTKLFDLVVSGLPKPDFVVDTDHYANTLFTLYILPRYNDWGLGVSDEELDETDSINAICLPKLFDIYNSTYTRYNRLLSFYTMQEANLLEAIETTSSASGNGTTTNTGNGTNSSNTTGTNRVNDTPQNGGDWSNDNHTSSLVENTGEVNDTTSNTNSGTSTSTYTQTISSDKETLMSRLDEVRKKFTNLYADWCNEFNSIFIYV